MAEHNQDGGETPEKKTASQSELKNAFGAVQSSFGLEPDSSSQGPHDLDWLAAKDARTFVDVGLTAGSAAGRQIADKALISIMHKNDDSPAAMEEKLIIARGLDGTFQVTRHPEFASNFDWEELKSYINSPLSPDATPLPDEDITREFPLEVSADAAKGFLGMIETMRDQEGIRRDVYGHPQDTITPDDLAYFVGSLREARANLQ